MDKIEVERIGGLAGFGGPGSRVSSRGTASLSALSAEDRTAVETLFSQRQHANVGADGFRYRVTRVTANGSETIEVPEADVPEAIRSSVRDVLL